MKRTHQIQLVRRDRDTSPPPPDWLNPRRRLYAERLVRFLEWNGRKVIFTPEKYADVRRESGLFPNHVDQAADDLFDLGLIDIHVAGAAHVLTLLLPEQEALIALFGGRVGNQNKGGADAGNVAGH